MKTLHTTVRQFVITLGLTSCLFNLPAVAQTTAAATVAAEQSQACACFDVKVVGQGPAILLIPGVASSGDVWQSTVAALQDQYQLHIFTLAGFAGQAPLSQQQWAQGYLASQQQAILHYIADKQLGKPVVIGHSLGGFLALSLAANASDKITAAINVDGLPALGAMFRQSAAASPAAKPSAATPSAPPQRAAFDPMAMAKSMANNADWQQRIVADMYRSDGMTSGRVMGELMQQDIRGQLNQISVPVLTLGALLHGSPQSKPEQVQATYESQLENIPKAYYHAAYTADSRHFIMADAPQWMNDQISQFLAALPAAKAE